MFSLTSCFSIQQGGKNEDADASVGNRDTAALRRYSAVSFVINLCWI